jgi:hypothetical protein
MTTSRSRARASSTSSEAGCGVVVLILIAVALAIEFWYVIVSLLAAAVVLKLVRTVRKRQAARYRSGPADPWCDEVTVALAELGFEGRARNQYPALRGVPTLGSVELRSRFLALEVVLFADAQAAHDAEMALRADRRVRDALRHGARAVISRGSVLHLAGGRHSVVDEVLLDEAVRTVDRLRVRLIPTAAGPGLRAPSRRRGSDGAGIRRSCAAAKPGGAPRPGRAVRRRVRRYEGRATQANLIFSRLAGSPREVAGPSPPLTR